jgi:hypothetical protein
MESGLRVRTAIVTIGFCLPLLTAYAAGNVGESALRATATSVEQVALSERRDSIKMPSAAVVMLLNERVAFVARARDDSPSASRLSTTPSVAAPDDDASGEPHPLMMLLSALALIAYVIGRRGIQRG